jgi:hypothetical protein
LAAVEAIGHSNILTGLRKLFGNGS